MWEERQNGRNTCLMEDFTVTGTKVAVKLMWGRVFNACDSFSS